MDGGFGKECVMHDSELFLDGENERLHDLLDDLGDRLKAIERLVPKDGVTYCRRCERVTGMTAVEESTTWAAH